MHQFSVYKKEKNKKKHKKKETPKRNEEERKRMLISEYGQRTTKPEESQDSSEMTMNQDIW